MSSTAVEAGVSPARNCSGGCVSRGRVERPFLSAMGIILCSFAVEIVLTKLAAASWAPASHWSLPIADSGKLEWGIGVLKIEH